MLSDFQKKKFTYLVKVMDPSGDGHIDDKDLELVVQRVAEVRGAGTPAAKLKELSDKYRFMHAGMMSMADTNKSGHVTLDEWLAYLDKVVADKAMYEQLVGALTGLFHELMDHDGDGKNDLADYKSFLRVLRVDEAQAADIFKRLDKNGDGQVTLPELNELLVDFYKGTDPEAPGNYFFGKF